MLSVFPTMFLALLAHALLRIFVGATLLYLGITHIKKQPTAPSAITPARPSTLLRTLGVLEVTIALMFIIGFMTQIAALAGILLAFGILLFYKKLRQSTLPQRLFYVLLIGACLSLFITGAGVLAFDLPI